MPFSPDGYLHISRQSLDRMALEHLVSGMDDEPAPVAVRCGSAAELSGYTEWVSPDEPALSIGWDWAWRMAPETGAVVRLGLPRTNVLLLSDAAVPLPWEENLEVLARFIDALAWQQPALAAACRSGAIA